jgi:hypothetical protein
MSTNIQIDVVLQRLQEQAKQVLGQNRSERQEREEAQLQAQQATQAEDQAAGNATRTAPQTLAAQRTAAADEHSAVPDTYKKRRPAAQREGGSVAAVTYRTITQSAEDATITLRVGTPDFEAQVEVPNIFDPGLVTVNDITLPASGSGGDSVEAVGGIHYVDSFYTNAYQAWSGLDISGTGSPPLLYQGTTAPPLSSVVDVWTASYDTYNADQSRALVLPSGRASGVFIYVHNRIKIFNTFRRIQRRSQQSENPRSETVSAADDGTGTWYDLRQTNRVIFEYVDTQSFAAYEIYAFAFSPTAVRAITAPDALRSYIEALCPPLTVNGTTSKLVESGGGQVAGYGPGSSSYFFTLPNVYDDMPTVDTTAWLADTVYGSYPSGNDVLAKQYGIGWLQYSSHAGNFFSPAVFSFVKGSLDLQALDAKQYAAMRVQLGNKPPAKFLAPCVQTCSTDDTDFYYTSTQPVSTTTPVPEADFRLDRRYRVKNGEVSDGTVYYCWDWDNTAYCRSQLTSIGFSSADLTP